MFPETFNVFFYFGYHVEPFVQDYVLFRIKKISGTPPELDLTKVISFDYNPLYIKQK